jgi:septal ring factor EnvC (AmiA/AmiB activator)
VVPDDAAAYERGVEAGRVEHTLQEHAEHLAKINGSMERVAQQLHELVLAVQRLGDQAEARDATVIATAHALEKAEAARRASSERTWSPFAKIFAALGAAAAVAAVVAVWLSAR